MPLFDDGKRSASARALERSVVLGIPYFVVRAALDEEPELLWNVVGLLAERLRDHRLGSGRRHAARRDGPYRQALAGVGG